MTRDHFMDKLKITRAIVVEGKYDKIKVSSVADALIITTDGFGIFNEKEKRALLKLLARERGLIVLSDSDSAGRLIRNHLYSFIPKDQLIDLYIPKVYGKEKRKDAPSKEGTLGVEGMESAVIRSLLEPYAAGASRETADLPLLTKSELFEDGFIGQENSSVKRSALLNALGLPRDMSTNALIRAVNLLGGLPVYQNAKRSALS